MRKRYKPYGTSSSAPGPDYPRRVTTEVELDPATRIRSFTISLFDRQEGHAADWPLVAETLFRAAFAALDEAGSDKRSMSILRRVHGGAYDRIVGNNHEHL